MSEGERAASPALIADAASARSLAQRLAAASSIAFDTEGDGMFRYRTHLCTMQFACGDEVALVDSLAFDALPVFAAVLGESGPEKIVHDASFDARLLFAHGVRLGRVFDTSVAARFLGLKTTGLASLLAQFFHIDLPKHKQRANWGVRPLDEEALRYLADDVRYLTALADVLLARLRDQDIEAEVREECAYVLSEAQQPVREVPPWTRVRNAALRSPRERARLYEMCLAREELARELDLPPGRVVPNEVLEKLAELRQASPQDVARLLGASRASPFAERFVDALARARDRADAPAEEVYAASPRPPSPAELERKKARKRRLMELRTREALRRGVDPQVVLPGHCLQDIIDLPEMSLDALRGVRGFGACRVERYGRDMVAELTSLWSV